MKFDLIKEVFVKNIFFNIVANYTTIFFYKVANFIW